ncbi:MAG: hypothetical protein ACO3UN_08690 [Candidatus Puniceispirillaceae bacterium]
MKKFLEMFKGDRGEVSSKRVVGIVGAVVLFATMAHNSLSDVSVAPSPELVAAVEWITIACLGFTSIDKFAKPTKDENQ